MYVECDWVSAEAILLSLPLCMMRDYSIIMQRTAEHFGINAMGCSLTLLR